MAEHDFTQGTYRRIYSGALRGRRINAVSMEAELTFWRLHMLADDNGVFHADPDLMPTDLYPRRREVTEQQCQTWIDELANIGLVSLYEANGEAYGQISGFADRQPSPRRNGKRIAKHPEPVQLGAVGCMKVQKGAEGAIEQSKTHNENENEKDNDKDNENEKGGRDAPDGCTAPHAPASSSDSSKSVFEPHSDSDSAAIAARQKARTKFHAAMIPLIGRVNGSRHAPGSAQHEADITSMNRMFDAAWPEELNTGPGYARLMDLVGKAKTKKKPMAWITSMLKKGDNHA